MYLTIWLVVFKKIGARIFHDKGDFRISWVIDKDNKKTNILDNPIKSFREV